MSAQKEPPEKGVQFFVIKRLQVCILYSNIVYEEANTQGGLKGEKDTCSNKAGRQIS